MTFKVIQIDVTTTGSAGSATGTQDSEPLHGVLEAVEIDYLSTAPNTTTVDIDTLKQGDATDVKVLDKAGSNTDITHYPRKQLEDNTGTAITGQYGRFVLTGRKVRVSVAASNALVPAVRVRLILEV